MCPKGDDRFRGGCKRIELMEEDRENMDLSCSHNSSEESSQLSTFYSMSRRSQNLVYKRRKLTGNSIVCSLGKGQESTRRIGDCISVVICNTRLVAPNGKNVALQAEQENGAVREPTFLPIINSELDNGFIDGEGLVDKAPKSSAQIILEVDSVNDSCSSSKSNTEQVLSSCKVELDDASECSSSSVVAMNYTGEYLSEKEYCMCILRSHGLLRKEWGTRSFESSEDTNTGNVESYCQPCKICSRSETTTKLLICDHCENAFHMACCKPRIKKVPCDEWFCHSCVKKGCKTSKDKVKNNLLNSTNEQLNECRSLSFKGKYNPIGLMSRNNEPYRTSVRIGKAFQAEVPDWSGPIANDDAIGESAEMNPSEFLLSHDLNPSNTSNLGPLNNWIQCREVLDGQNGTICGKWRRAPYNEFQTDEWECYCSVRWDPAHADCAVPQEIETDEVLKQLKYIEKLRPRLLAKWKVQGHIKSNGNFGDPNVFAVDMHPP